MTSLLVLPEKLHLHATLMSFLSKSTSDLTQYIWTCHSWISISLEFWNGGNNLGAIHDRMPHLLVCFSWYSPWQPFSPPLLVPDVSFTYSQLLCWLFISLWFCLSSASSMSIDPHTHLPNNTFSSAYNPVLILKTRMRDLTTTKHSCELCCFLANYFLLITIKQRPLWY